LQNLNRKELHHSDGAKAGAVMRYGSAPAQILLKKRFLEEKLKQFMLGVPTVFVENFKKFLTFCTVSNRL
jgi:hypothetical protein